MKEGSIGISVIICCYNSAEKIPTTLKYLAKQVQPVDIEYEVILVDNNCTDNTVQVANQSWNSFGNPFPFKIVKQPKAGLTYARQLGIKASAFEYIILCDDDNWLCIDYLKKAFGLFQKLPQVVLIGGVGEAVFETVPPQWFPKVNGFGYAVGTEEPGTGLVDSIYGAGMGIRRSVFQKLIADEILFILSDRQGNSLSSGGDTEMCMIVKKNGYKIYLDTSLTFKHFLSSERLKWNYYLKLRRSFGKANAYLQLYNHELNNGLRKHNRTMQFLFLVKYIYKNLKYVLLPKFYKNAHCANIHQQLKMRITNLSEFNKIEIIAERFESNEYHQDAVSPTYE